jgi:hypothetical protein
VGVCGLCTNESGDIIGGHFPEDVFDSDSLECRYRYQVTGEKWGFCRTDVLRDYPFPDDVVGHVPEGIVWSAIARRYKTRFINKALRIYYWAPDSITQAGVEKGGAERNAEGHALWARTVLEDEISWFFFNPQWFLKMAANYTRFHFLLQKRQPHKSYPIRGMLPSLLVIMMWPLGYLLYLNDSSGRGSHRP